MSQQEFSSSTDVNTGDTTGTAPQNVGKSPAPGEADTMVYDTIARNILISGTPGCGKSYFVDNVLIPSITKKDKIESKKYTYRITFTDGLTHEDFFGCYKPITEKIKIKKDTTWKTLKRKFYMNFSLVFSVTHCLLL